MLAVLSGGSLLLAPTLRTCLYLALILSMVPIKNFYFSKGTRGQVPCPSVIAMWLWL